MFGLGPFEMVVIGVIAVVLFGGNLLENSQFLFGMQNLFILLAAEPRRAHALYDKLVALHLENLEKFLGARTGRPVHVLNLGLPALRFDSEVTLFEDFADKVRPDLVLFYHGANDALSWYHQTVGRTLDQLGIERYCCRRMIMTHVDLIDDVLPYP